MYIGFLHLHSGIRYLILVVVLLALLFAVKGLLSKSNYSKADNLLSLISMILVHTQLLLGFVLYFISPKVQAGLSDMGAAMKDEVLRFYVVEHLTAMLVAIVLITIGRIKAKKLENHTAKHKVIAVTFGVAYMLILYGVYANPTL